MGSKTELNATFACMQSSERKWMSSNFFAKVFEGGVCVSATPSAESIKVDSVKITKPRPGFLHIGVLLSHDF